MTSGHRVEILESTWSDEMGFEIRRERHVFGRESHEQTVCYTREGHLIGSLDMAHSICVIRRITPDPPMAVDEIAADELFLMAEEPDPEENLFCLVPPPGDHAVTPAVVAPLTEARVKELREADDSPFAGWLAFPVLLLPVPDPERDRSRPCCTGIDPDGVLWAWRESPTGHTFRGFSAGSLEERRAEAYRWLSGAEQMAMAAERVGVVLDDSR